IIIKPDLSVTVKAPNGVSFVKIKDFVLSRQDWICQKLEEYERAPEPLSQTLSEQETLRLKKEARRQITQYVAHYAGLMQAPYGRIAIKEQKTCWGSCSSKRNLNFNWKLVLMPPEIMEYVVVHELAHLFEMNHSKAFWDIVGHYLPDYKVRRRWLKENGKLY
ncbi:MAG: M48 family metallopeptidase, partial [Lachnospiraceae bacterium]|nr:M48 family metallopeptidase [Lachnospiraceae bacterium]